MTVLHVGKYYPPVPGGMERVLQLLCEHERAAIDSRVLCLNQGRRTICEVRRGVPVTRAGSLVTIGSVGLSLSLPWWLRRTAADVTVIHEPNPLALVADFLTRRRGPLVVYFHSEVVRAAWKYRFFYRPFLSRVLDRADRILVASPPMRDTAAQLADHREKCVVVPYGIDMAPLTATAEIQRQVREIRAESPLPQFLFVGRLVPYKGVDVLLRAMVGIQGRLAIVGDGPMRGALQQLRRDLGLDDRVVFHGSLPDSALVANYHACDVFVLPSVTRAEAFGMVQIEAMACGKPVVSTNLPSGVPWVNRHGETGLVVQAGDVNSLHQALAMLAANQALRAELGAGARARAEQEFTATRMAERTRALYAEILEEAKRRERAA